MLLALLHCKMESNSVSGRQGYTGYEAAVGGAQQCMVISEK